MGKICKYFKFLRLVYFSEFNPYPCYTNACVLCIKFLNTQINYKVFKQKNNAWLSKLGYARRPFIIPALWKKIIFLIQKPNSKRMNEKNDKQYLNQNNKLWPFEFEWLPKGKHCHV